jgi:hypothetical protein
MATDIRHPAGVSTGRRQHAAKRRLPGNLPDCFEQARSGCHRETMQQCCARSQRLRGRLERVGIEQAGGHWARWQGPNGKAVTR